MMGSSLRAHVLLRLLPVLLVAIVAQTSMGGVMLSGNWQTVVNNSYTFPGDTRPFNSYNQPSINDAGTAVFRARSRGGMAAGGEPSSGIFTRDTSSPGTALNTVATRNTAVPTPSPLPSGVTSTGATFNEFPSIPRIDQNSDTIVTRGQSPPTLEVPDPTSSDPTATTRVGTTGIYTNPSGTLLAGAANVGNVPGFEQHQVPNTTPGTRFDQFPGAPSVTNGSDIVFKGNWIDSAGQSQTGVYWRDTSNPLNANVRIADSTMEIPGSTTLFGSTAPPSAANGQAVFLGVDNEDNPAVGGIYSTSLTTTPTLNPLALIGQAAPGLAPGMGSQPFTSLGEALSFDGRYVAFWAGVGTDTVSLTLHCPDDGNQDRLDYCLNGPDGIPGTGDEFDLYPVTVPKNQGIYVADLVDNSLDLVASTWGPGGFTDFVYWSFTGRPPGVGGGDEEDFELARWRSTSYLAVDDGMVAFKANKGDTFGLYLATSPSAPIQTIAEQGWAGSLIDPMAAGMTVTGLGIEREGFRGSRIAITASMANELESMAGIYVTATVPEPASFVVWLTILAGLSLTCVRASVRLGRSQEATESKLIVAG